ncbi:MAG: hypothetical protein AAFY72_03935 [Cyanobacteria bacterium J06649_4]
MDDHKTKGQSLTIPIYLIEWGKQQAKEQGISFSQFVSDLLLTQKLYYDMDQEDLVLSPTDDDTPTDTNTPTSFDPIPC